MPDLVALQARLPQFESPVESQAKVLQLRQLMNSDQVSGLEMQQRRQALADDAAVRQAYANNADPAERLKALALASPKAYQAEVKARQEAEKNSSEVDYKKSQTRGEQLKNAHSVLEIAGQQMQYVYQNPTVDNANAVLDKMQQLGVYTPEHVAKVREQINANPDPNQIRSLAEQGYRGALSAKDQLPTIVTKNVGGTTETDAFDPITGQRRNLASVVNTESPDSVASQATIRRGQNLTRQTQLEVNGLDKNGQPMGDVEAMAQAIAKGQLAPISGFALAKPRGQQIMARVMDINPGYDMGDFQSKNAALKAFSTGKEGGALRSFNVAIDHLDTLGQMADALKNRDTRILNTIGNAFSKQTGEAAPTNFEAVKAIVSKEVVKAIVAGGGGVGEREEISHLMDKANSPAQLKGVIDHFTELMSAQKAGLLDQYQRTTGRSDGEQVFAARRHGSGQSAKPSEAASMPPAATNSRGWALHMDANGNKAYVSPDGKQFEEVK